MERTNTLLYFVSAAVAVFSSVGYHTLVKRVSPDIHPLVSVTAIYVFVLLLSLLALPFLVSRAELGPHIGRISWVQFGIALTVMGIEIGFLLMYRNGWDLSLGNVVTGVFINIVLAGIGILFLKEQLSAINITGIVLCIAGVAMAGWRG